MNNCTEFHKLFIILPVHDEIQSLRETVLGFEKALNPEDISCIIIFQAPNTTEACRAEAARLSAEKRSISLSIVQEKGGNIRAEFQEILKNLTETSSHCLIWTADMDAYPEKAAQMLKKSKENPSAIIKLSRFISGSGLPSSKGWFINLRDSTFTWLVCKLFGNHQTDPYFGLTIFPIRDFLRLNLKEKYMSFTIEYPLCFERLGAKFIEIPLKQMARTEGKNNMAIINKLRYFVPVFRVRFAPKRKLLLERDTDGKT